MKLRLIALFILFVGLISFSSCRKDKISLPDRLQTALDNSREEAEITGIAVAVWTEENGSWIGVSGESHPGVSITPDMRFGIASMTKPFTASLCLMFQEEGLLDLDDPISTWLPPYKNIDSSITLRQLLNHQSGLSDYVTEENILTLFVQNPDKIWTIEELLDLVKEPIGEPGEFVTYANTNYILAGMILEKVSNKSYLDLLKERIIVPYNLVNTYLEGYEPVQGFQAHPHAFGVDIADMERTGLGTASWAAGGLVSTVDDLQKFWKAFNGDLLTQESREQARQFRYGGVDNDGHGLGLFEFVIDDRLYEGHTGATIGYNSVSIYSKDKKQYVSILMNNSLSKYKDITDAIIQVLNE